MLLTIGGVLTYDIFRFVSRPHVADKADSKQSFYKVNIKNSLITLTRNLENLFLQQTEWLTSTINHMVDSINFCKQKERPGRKYDRVSKKPVKKWYATKNKNKVASCLPGSGSNVSFSV